MDRTENTVQSAKDPLVSVIVRNYNRGKRTLRALDSIVSQTWRDFEIVLVDDGSTDDSLALVEEKYGNLDYLRIIRCGINSGASQAANAGVEMSRGRYIAFLDSDDQWLPNFLQAHMEAHLANPAMIMTYCDYIQVWEEFGIERLKRCHKSDNQRRDFLLGGFVHTMSMTVTLKQAIESVGGFNPEYQISHDFDVWLKIALSVDNPFYYIDQPLMRYHLSTDGVTTRFQRWADEYHTILEMGFAHEAAEPWLDIKEEALKTTALGVLGRKQTSQWLAKCADFSFSVIIYTHNRLNFLVRALESARLQTWEDVEIIVFDDNSNDGTTKWLAELEMHNLTVISADSYTGPARALNEAAKKSSGKLLAFLRDCDEWHEDFLAHHARAQSFVTTPPVFSYCDYYLKRPNMPAGEKRENGPDYHSFDLLYQQLFKPFPDRISSMVTSRKNFTKCGGFNPNLKVGYTNDLILKLLSLGEGRSPYLANYSPVHIRKHLLSQWHGIGPQDTLRSQQLLAAEAQTVFESFLQSDAGSRYIFHENEIIENFLAMANRDLQETEECRGYPNSLQDIG
jgi:glycosyltransferase involved in cell wall biosynthesis